VSLALSNDAFPEGGDVLKAIVVAKIAKTIKTIKLVGEPERAVTEERRTLLEKGAIPVANAKHEYPRICQVIS
jgi:hypothetical protein